MAEPSLTTLLQQRANQQPGGTAYTFIDYDVDPAGVAQSLTWAQLHRRAQVVAEELRVCGSSGDRAAIPCAARTRLHRCLLWCNAGGVRSGSVVGAALGHGLTD